MKKNIFYSSAFTLIEMLVVISIIGILAVLVSANLNSARSRARDAVRKSDLKNMETALRIYYNDNQAYPTKAQFPAAGTTWKSASGNVYMNTVPADPLPSQGYIYTPDSVNDTFTLQACLENKSDSSGLVTTTDWCPTGWMFQLKP